MGKKISLFKKISKFCHDPRPTFRDLSKSAVRIVKGGELTSNQHKALPAPGSSPAEVNFFYFLFFYFFGLLTFIFVRNRFSIKNTSFICKGCIKNSSYSLQETSKSDPRLLFPLKSVTFRLHFEHENVKIF